METVMNNEAVVFLVAVSAYKSFMKTVMSNKVRKILGRLKSNLRRPQSWLGYLRKMAYTYS